MPPLRSEREAPSSAIHVQTERYAVVWTTEAQRNPDVNYAHPDPLFLDFETQSAADIRECGGRLYASHPSTRVLMLAAFWSGEYHLWIPAHIRGNLTPDLWPHELQPKCHVNLFRDATCPQHIIDASRTRPIIAHNAYGFDRFIWERFVDSIKAEWLDSMLVAKSSNRPGSLDALGRQVLGKGKDLASKLMPALCQGVSYSPVFRNWVYPIIRAGDLQAFSRYAISDVEILRRLWESFSYLDVEDDVIAAHDAINQRGVKVDKRLLQVIESVGDYSVSKAEDEIAEITSGRINANNLRSTKQIHEWLSEYGVSIVDDNGKPCLRKEIVKRWIDSPYVIDENLSAVREIPPLVIQVLSLRLKALRITSAKVTRALSRMGEDRRIRDLHSYHQAGTGRWSSSGVQIHNLPRPIKGIDIETILDSIKDYPGNDAAELYTIIKAHTPTGLTVDDTLSALVRPCFVAEDGYVLCPCDFSQIEARCLAWIADEKKLLYAFAEGRDVYKEFGATLYNCTPAEIAGIKRDVSKVVVLGCGYGLGADKFRVYAANAGIDLQKAEMTAEQAIESYRSTYTNIAGFKPDKAKSFRTNGVWHKLDAAVKTTVVEGIETSAGKCKFFMRNRDMGCVLPSGRIVWYPDARMADIIPGYAYTLGLPLVPKATVVYQSPRGLKVLYGGLMTENVCQAICRDLLAVALVRLEASALPPVLHVHDEGVPEVRAERAFDSIKEIVRIMSDRPSWAHDFPIACEGFTSPRFTKSPFRDSWKCSTGKEPHK